MEAVATGARVRREYVFEVRLIEEGSLWSLTAVRTFKAHPMTASFRGGAVGFRMYREEMARNGFELCNVRVTRRGGRA